MSFLLILIVIILIVLINRKDRDARSRLDYHSSSYRQGYWDGVRASEQGISSTKTVGESSQQPVSTIYPALATTAEGQPLAPIMPEVEERNVNNHVTVNIALYVASLLLVGGVSLFVNLFIPGSITTFFWVLLTAVAYYGFGFLLYRSVPILKSVSLAFIGTALVIMPYVGYLLNQSLLPSASACWLITSIVCLVAYMYAAIRLHSELIGYCIILIIAIAANSFVGVFGASIFWFIVATMVVGATITFVAASKPRWLPTVLTKPFIATQHVLVPLALLWAMVMWLQLDMAQYAIIFAVATLYYAAAALQSAEGSSRRNSLWIAARGTLTIAAGFFAYEMTDSVHVVGIVLAGVGVLQAVVSAISLPIGQRFRNHHETWLWTGLGLAVVSGLLAFGSESWAVHLTGELVGLVIVATLIAGYLRRSEFLAFSVYGIVLIPFLAGYYIANPPINAWILMLVYGVLTMATLFVRARYVRAGSQTNMSLVYVAQLALSYMTIAMGLAASGGSNHWWLFVAMIIVALTAYGTAYIERSWQLITMANVVAVVALCSLSWALHLSAQSSLFLVASIGFLGFYSAYAIARVKKAVPHVQLAMWWSSLAVATALSLIGVFMNNKIYVACFALLLIIAGTIAVYDDYRKRQIRLADLALIISVIGVQRLLAVLLPGINVLVYSHWWVIALFVLAYLRARFAQTKQDRDLSLFYQVIALLVLSFSGLQYATDHSTEEWSRILFLVEHVALVAYGLVRNSKLFTLWGAAGVTVAILEMLPGFAFLLLPLLGLGIIAVVIVVIIRSNAQSTKKP